MSPTLAGQARADVKRTLLDFASMPGDRFSEHALAQRLRVSRTPLRAALQQPACEGFLRRLPRHGRQPAPLDFDVKDERYDLRELLECEAARHLAARAERPALDALAATWRVDAPRRERDAGTVGALDANLHAQPVAASGNREMARVHREITGRIRIVRRLDLTKPARVEATCAEHARVLGALLRRRADEAQRLLRAHIGQSKRDVRHIGLDTLQRARRSAAGDDGAAAAA